MVMATIPVVPIPRPGKQRHRIEHHRQVSIFDSLFKLLDRLLYGRLAPGLLPTLLPAQLGGLCGADEAAWLLVNLLLLCQDSGHQGKVCLGFLDAEAAFCRPPPGPILRVLWDLGVRSGNWLLLHRILGGT